MTYRQLFRFAQTWEQLLTGFGVFAAAVHGVVMPMFALVFKEMFDGFQAQEEVINEVGRAATWFALLGVGTFFVATIQVRK